MGSLMRGRTRGLVVLATLLGLVGAGGLAPTVAHAELQPPEPVREVRPSPIPPDTAYSLGSGRVEIYTSIGNNDGTEKRPGFDWRPVNEMAWLISSVPRGGEMRLAIYNTLQDGSAALNKKTGKWETFDKKRVNGKIPSDAQVVEKTLSVAWALRDQLNNYSTAAERKKHIKVIGQRDALKISERNGSGMADLLLKSGVTKLCDKKKKKKGACIATDKTADMHSKFGLFSQAKDSNGKLWKYVTLVTTANLNGASGGSAANTTVVIFGDKKLYQNMIKQVWTPMMNEKSNAAYKKAAANGIKGSLPGVTYYPSPRTIDFEGNYLKSLLTKVNRSNCTIRVVHSMFSTGRRSGIGQTLKTLKGQGCRIRIVLDKDFVAKTFQQYFTMDKWLGSFISDIRYQNLHDKTMTITNGSTRALFTGSANFNGPGLYADESVILLDKGANARAVKAVEAHADFLYRLAKVKKIPVAKVSLNRSSANLAIGATLQLKAKVSPSNAREKALRWSSSNRKVATVNSKGLITAVKPGAATITVKSLSGGITDVAEITVGSKKLAPPKLKASSSRPEVGKPATISLSWSSGTVDGTVQMQYQNPKSGDWVDAKDGVVQVAKSKGEFTFTPDAGRVWRSKSLDNLIDSTDANRIVQDSSRYSSPLTILPVAPASETPVLTATPRVKTGSEATFVASWANPHSVAEAAEGASAAPDEEATTTKLPAELTLQYKDGKNWVDKATAVIGEGKTSVEFKQKLTGAARTTNWRILPTANAVPQGGERTPSKSVDVVVYTDAPKPKLSGPKTFKSGAAVTFTATWKSPYTQPAKLAFQYKSGSSWKTKTTVTIPKGKTSAKFSVKLVDSHHWRLEVTSAAVPEGVSRPVSATLKMTVAK